MLYVAPGKDSDQLIDQVLEFAIKVKQFLSLFFQPVLINTDEMHLSNNNSLDKT